MVPVYDYQGYYLRDDGFPSDNTYMLGYVADNLTGPYKLLYDVQKRTVFIYRANSGGEPTRSQTKVQLSEKASRIKLTAYVDSSSIELFVNDGEKTLT